MPRPSPQFVIAAAASILAMSALALSVPQGHDGERGTPGLFPAEASLELPELPTFMPTLR